MLPPVIPDRMCHSQYIFGQYLFFTCISICSKIYIIPDKTTCITICTPIYNVFNGKCCLDRNSRSMVMMFVIVQLRQV